MKKRGFSFLLAGLLALAMALPVFAQPRTPIVISKRAIDAGVAVTANGNLWTAAQYIGNYGAALVSVRKSGTVTGCTLTFYTGQTAATATNALDDANNNFSCATAVNKVINNLDQYLQGTVSSWTGTGTITVYVTLVNGVGWNMNATISAVTQSTGSGAPGSYWYARLTNGTTGFLDVSNGVGAQGAGVLQVGTLGTISAAVASATMTQVVAAPGSGSIVLLGIFVEKATATTGLVTVSSGTGTNCGTGTATLLSIGAGSPPIGFYPVGALVGTTKALCLTTDAATTSARALTQ
jgi:hypothetical protein